LEIAVLATELEFTARSPLPGFSGHAYSAAWDDSPR